MGGGVEEGVGGERRHGGYRQKERKMWCSDRQLERWRVKE